MKKISLSIFVALLAVAMAVPASAAKLTVDGEYTNKWTYVDGNISPNNLLDNQALALNLTLTEGDMFKAYLPLTITSKLNADTTRGIQIGMTNKWYISFVSDEVSVWASQNNASGYKFSSVGDPMGIGKNIAVTISSLVKDGYVSNFNDHFTSPSISTSLNILLKGQFKFGAVNYTTYVADNTLTIKDGNVTVGTSDYISSVNRLTVDLPYDITVGATASYVTKKYVFDENTQKDKFSQLTLSADASYNLPIENIGGKLTVAAAAMFQREGMPADGEKTKLKFVNDSLGFFVGATDFKLGPVTVGADFSLTQPEAFSLTATYPSTPKAWSDRALGTTSSYDRFYYITDSTSRYLPNTMILNANLGSDFNLGRVGVALTLNNKLNMLLKDVYELKSNFSSIVNNITTLDADFTVTDDIILGLNTTFDYRVAVPFTGLKLASTNEYKAYPVIDTKVDAAFNNLGLTADARVRYSGIEGKNPIEGAVSGKFSKSFAINDNITVTPTVAAGALAWKGNNDNDLNAVGYVALSSDIDKYTVGASYLLDAYKWDYPSIYNNPTATDDDKKGSTVYHVVNVNGAVKLSDIFTLKAGYTFRTDLSDSLKEMRHFASASLTAQVSSQTKLVLSYGDSGLGSSKDASGFDSGKAWAGLKVKPSTTSMHWDKLGLSLSVKF